MTKLSAHLTAFVALIHATAAEPRPPPGRPDRKESNPCFPSDLDTVGGNSDASLPPCLRQSKIMQACGMRGNDADLSASDMQKCFCDGSFFEDLIGCGSCLNYQRMISSQDYDEGKGVISRASSVYCQSSQTADLDSVLSSVLATGTLGGKWAPTQSPTTPRPTAASNYFTATAKRQGPGLESLVTQRTLTGQAPTPEPTDDGAESVSASVRLGALCFTSCIAVFLFA